MSASIRSGGQCPFCTKRGLPQERHALLECDHNLSCLTCGVDLGAVPDSTPVPEPIARLMQLFVRCGSLQLDYAYSQSSIGDVKGASVNFKSKHNEHCTAQIIWRYERPDKVKGGQGKWFGPEQVTPALAPEIFQVMLVLRTERFRITEMPCRDPLYHDPRGVGNYARLEFVFGRDDAPLAVVNVPHGELPDVLLTRIELKWK